jgi:hypothetical protein
MAKTFFLNGDEKQAVRKWNQVVERYPEQLAAIDAHIWLQLVGLRNNPENNCCFNLYTLGIGEQFNPALIARRWWALALSGMPGQKVESDSLTQRSVYTQVTSSGRWFTDPMGVPVDPAEALKRTLPQFKCILREMLDFRAAFDNRWAAWSSSDMNLSRV